MRKIKLIIHNEKNKHVNIRIYDEATSTAEINHIYTNNRKFRSVPVCLLSMASEIYRASKSQNFYEYSPS